MQYGVSKALFLVYLAIVVLLSYYSYFSVSVNSMASAQGYTGCSDSGGICTSSEICHSAYNGYCMSGTFSDCSDCCCMVCSDVGDGTNANGVCDEHCGADSTCNGYKPNTCIQGTVSGIWCDNYCEALSDGDVSKDACNCVTGGSGVWVSSVSKCCGDDGSDDTFVASEGACCSGSWHAGADCCSDSDCQAWQVCNSTYQCECRDEACNSVCQNADRGTGVCGKDSSHPYNYNGDCYCEYQCGSNSDCPSGEVCDLSSHTCVEAQKETGSLCFDGKDNDGDGLVDYCDDDCNGAQYQPDANHIAYVYQVCYAGSNEQCAQACKARGYSYGKVEPCHGCGGSCICDKLVYTPTVEPGCGGENEACCPTGSNGGGCTDYQGNVISNGGWGYPSSEAASECKLWYCNNGEWVSTLPVTVTNEYPSCQSLGFDTGTSAPSCYKGAGIDPPGTPTGIDFCVNLPSSSSQTTQACNSGLHCCSDDNKCHECCSDSDCTNSNAPICDLNNHVCRHCTSKDCGTGCCLYDIGAGGACVGEGNITNIGGKSYLCDPPMGFVIDSNQSTEREKQNSKPEIKLIDIPFYFLFKILAG